MNSFLALLKSLRTGSNNGCVNYGVMILAAVVNAINTSEGSLLAKSFYRVAISNKVIGESWVKNNEAAK